MKNTLIILMLIHFGLGVAFAEDASLELENWPDKTGELQEQWREVKKAPLLDSSEFKARLSSGKWVLSEFKPVFKPVVSKGKLEARRVRVDAILIAAKSSSIDGKADKDQLRFPVKSCSSFMKLYEEAAPKKILGRPPYQVTTGDGILIVNGKNIFTGFKQDCEAQAGHDGEDFGCPHEEFHSYGLLSKVGPLVTYEINGGGITGCGVPNRWSEVITLDLRTNKPAKITEFFDEKSLVQVLKSDKVVRNVWTTGFLSGEGSSWLTPEESAEEEIDQKKSLVELEAVKELKSFSTEKNFEFVGFGIHDPKRGDEKVRIRWALREANCQPCTHGHAWLGLDVKPTKWFQEEIKAIDPKDEMLMRK